MKKKNGLLQNIFLRCFENSSDELGTGILVTFENQSSIIYWFLLRYTAIIYKCTQGNLGAKKIARSRFQSPAKKKKLATDSAIPASTKYTSSSHQNVTFFL